MFGTDRNWDSGFHGLDVGSGRRDSFMADSRQGDEPVGSRYDYCGLKEPVFEKAVAYRIHRGDAREFSRGKVAGRGGAGGPDDRKKDARSTSKDPWSGRGNEDVDAVWHRGARPRNF